MKIKVFKIRLADAHLEADEKTINNFLATVDMKKSSTTLVAGAEIFWSVIVHYVEKTDEVAEPPQPQEEPNPKESKQKLDKISISDLTENEVYILDNLKSWRAIKAEEENIPPYMVLWDQHLMEVAKAKPRTREELIKVKGFSEKRVAKYGKEILMILGAF